MTQQEKRMELQGEAFNQLVENHRVILEWGTGVGKSRVAINFIDYLEVIEDKKKVLLLVAETAHKTNWAMEFTKALGEERAQELLGNIRMECYNSLGKCTGEEWDLVVADEGHHLRSDLKVEILRNLKTERILVLSATLSEKGDAEKLVNALNSVYGNFVTLHYDLQQAIDDGVLPEPHVNVHTLEMWNDAEKSYEGINQYLEKKKKEYIAATRDDGFFAKSEEELEAMKGRMLHAGNIRKQFLARLKTKMAARIIKQYREQNLRFICFCANIDQVDKLGGVNVVNSKQSKKVNKEIIDRFNDETIDSLFVVGMLQEGVSLKNIQAGLVVQLDGKARRFVQKFGRVMRSEKPILDILYVPESRDEDFLYTALENVKQDYVFGWDINEYKARKGIFKMKEISRETLVGPAASYTYIKTRYNTVPTEIHGAAFIGYGADNTSFQLGNTLNGVFGGLMIHVPTGQIYVNIFNTVNRTCYALRLTWRGCLGVLMPLASATYNHHAAISIRLLPDGKFAKTEVWVRGTALDWCKQEIPKEDEGARLNLVNNLIDRIQSVYEAGRENPTPAVTPRTTVIPSVPVPPQLPIQAPVPTQVQYPAPKPPQPTTITPAPQITQAVQIPPAPAPQAQTPTGIPNNPSYTTLGKQYYQQGKLNLFGYEH